MQKENYGACLAVEQKKKVADGLQKVLALTFVLYLKTHAYHWNITGSMFRSLHSLFEEQYIDLWNAVDLIAERIRALGYFTKASCTIFRELSKEEINEADEAPIKAEEMLHQLIDDNNTLICTIRSLLPKIDSADQPTIDMLSARMQIQEKYVWMLNSFLEIPN